MRLTEKQRELALGLLHGVGAQVPALLEAWKEAGEKEPPPYVKDDQLFTTIRRVPCDMKPEDGSLRYCQPPPFEGARLYSLKYFYEPAPPTGFPSLLVVVAWSCPSETVKGTQPTQPPGDE